jgi:rSAM/selenodomain-associated transferase 2
MSVPRLSIVVPVLDEAPGIAATLAALASLRAAGHEVIVVDGGSHDDTLARARPLADRVIGAARGRASQMNAGAAIARHDVLLFLHADTRLPPLADAMIARAIESGRRWGRFDVAIDGQSRWLPWIAAAMNLRSRVTGIATGDQGMFVERALFASVGGFPPIALMEDIELSSLLKRRAGRPACLRERVSTSGRRWDRDGAWRTIGLMWKLRLAWRLGVDAGTLARRYGLSAAPRRVLQVFAKAPEPGQVKTRLAHTLGEQAAVDAYRALVEHTLGVAVEARRRGVVSAVELWCAPDTTHPALVAWARRSGATLHAQVGADLGERMHGALRDGLARGVIPILIGTDCPGHRRRLPGLGVRGARDARRRAGAGRGRRVRVGRAVARPRRVRRHRLEHRARDARHAPGARARRRALGRAHDVVGRRHRGRPRALAFAARLLPMKPALLWLFPEGWDEIAMRHADSLRDRYDIVTKASTCSGFPRMRRSCGSIRPASSIAWRAWCASAASSASCRRTSNTAR